MPLLKHIKGLKPLATNEGAQGLRSLSESVAQKSIFSARTNLIDYVFDIKDAVQALASGDSNMATQILTLQQKLAGYGYTPEGGFPDAPDKSIPPAEGGSLRDLSSDGRIKLVLQTNFRQAENYEKKAAGNEPGALEQFPAWELVRIYEREIPRGERRGPKGTIVEVPEDGWPARFRQACEATGDDDALAVLDDTGRMIARKDSPVWDYLGDPDNFDDAIGTDYPPLAFNSGYGWRAVPRAECVEIGLIDEDDVIAPDDSEFASELQDDAETATLADLHAARSELLAAAAKLRGDA